MPRACADWGAFSAGRLVAIPLSSRVSPSWLLLGNFVGALGGIAYLSLCTEHTHRAHLWAATSLYGLSLSSAFPNVINHAERVLPVSGFVLSIFVVGSAFGEMLIPYIIAALQPSRPAAFFPAPLASVCVAQLGLLGVLRLVARHIPPPQPVGAAGATSSTELGLPS